MRIEPQAIALQTIEPITLAEKKKPEETQLKEAVQDFVSILLSKIFKDMDKAIPRSDLVQESYGQSWFRELVLDEYSKSASKQSMKKLAEIVYKQIAGGKDREY